MEQVSCVRDAASTNTGTVWPLKTTMNDSALEISDFIERLFFFILWTGTLLVHPSSYPSQVYLVLIVTNFTT